MKTILLGSRARYTYQVNAGGTCENEEIEATIVAVYNFGQYMDNINLLLMTDEGVLLEALYYKCKILGKNTFCPKYYK